MKSDDNFDRILEMNAEAERRKFAAMAMQAIITNGHYQIAEENGEETLASASVKAADALIKELNNLTRRKMNNEDL